MLAAEARKAEDSSEATRRTPNPSVLTGRLAWVYWMSVRSVLVMTDRPRRRERSNCTMCDPNRASSEECA